MKLCRSFSFKNFKWQIKHLFSNTRVKWKATAPILENCHRWQSWNARSSGIFLSICSFTSVGGKLLWEKVQLWLHMKWKPSLDIRQCTLAMCHEWIFCLSKESVQLKFPVEYNCLWWLLCWCGYCALRCEKNNTKMLTWEKLICGEKWGGQSLTATNISHGKAQWTDNSFLAFEWCVQCD